MIDIAYGRYQHAPDPHAGAYLLHFSSKTICAQGLWQIHLHRFNFLHVRHGASDEGAFYVPNHQEVFINFPLICFHSIMSK